MTGGNHHANGIEKTQSLGSGHFSLGDLMLRPEQVMIVFVGVS